MTPTHTYEAGSSLFGGVEEKGCKSLGSVVGRIMSIHIQYTTEIRLHVPDWHYWLVVEIHGPDMKIISTAKSEEHARQIAAEYLRFGKVA